MHLALPPFSVLDSGTLKSNTFQYSFEFDKVFECDDHIAAIGWPLDDPGFQGLSVTALKGMAGEGMSAPCLSSCLYAYWLNPYAPWWKATPGSESPNTKKRIYYEHKDIVFDPQSTTPK